MTRPRFSALFFVLLLQGTANSVASSMPACNLAPSPFPDIEAALGPVLSQIAGKPNKTGVSRFVRFEKLKLQSFRENQQLLISNHDAYSRLTIENRIEDADLNATLTCDRSFQLAPKRLSSSLSERDFSGKDYSSYHFKLKQKEEFNILLPPAARDCKLSYSDQNNPAQKGAAHLSTDSKAFPWLPALTKNLDLCGEPQLTCPHTVAGFESLDTPESGFLAKTEMLLGQKLPADFISKQDPYAPIDFSKAPKLKAVYLASLVFRGDFYGTVMARLLKYQADHGALVNIVTTDYMLLDKDRKLLEQMAAQNPNFRLQEFQYYDPGNTLTKPLRLVDDKFRDMHIKLMVTLSDEDERHNAVVFGGRNIHDGFLFKTRPDYSKLPRLVQYGTDDSFVHWNDFEMKLTSRELATTAASHLQRFLYRDTATETMDATSVPSKAVSPAAGDTFQHFISLPYSDDHALEKMYVALIDSAKTSIHLSSPYLRPTSNIMAAIKRASARKVEITIQTRVELTGDTQAWLYEEVNKASINELYGYAKIYKWKENSILHSKFILIDGKSGVIGSVNLSRRSFVQDVENGFLFHSESVSKSMEHLFSSYIEKSERISKPEPRKILPSAIIYLLQNQF